MTITSLGCGGGNTPSETVEEFYQLMEKKDCHKVAELVTDNEPELADRYVNDCKQITFVSHSIKGEEIEGNGVFAHVEVEVTIKENGVKKANSGARSFVKVDDDWKLTKIP